MKLIVKEAVTTWHPQVCKEAKEYKLAVSKHIHNFVLVKSIKIILRTMKLKVAVTSRPQEVISCEALDTLMTASNEKERSRTMLVRCLSCVKKRLSTSHWSICTIVPKKKKDGKRMRFIFHVMEFSTDRFNIPCYFITHGC